MIILASNSIKRKEILESIGLDFVVQPSNFLEEQIKDLDPEIRVKKLAFGKADVVYNENKDATIIAADTLVYFNKKFYGKPKNEKDAYKMLSQFSNTYHYVYTGVCILHKRKMFLFSDVSKVFFKSLTDKEIKDYISTGEAMGKAGSYEIQGRASKFLSFIDGDIFSVSGLPKERVRKILEEIGVLCEKTK